MLKALATMALLSTSAAAQEYCPVDQDDPLARVTVEDGLITFLEEDGTTECAHENPGDHIALCIVWDQGYYATKTEVWVEDGQLYSDGQKIPRCE